MSRLEVEQVGRPEWPRWIIRDSSDRFFTGSVWTKDPKQALVFAERTLADGECHRLGTETVPQEFRIVVEVQVLTDAPLSLEELKSYMRRCAHIELEPDDEQPFPSATFAITFDWNTFDK